MYSLFLLLTYLTILCLIILLKFNTYILTNIFVLLIYSRNIFICFLFINLFILSLTRKDLKSM